MVDVAGVRDVRPRVTAGCVVAVPDEHDRDDGEHEVRDVEQPGDGDEPVAAPAVAVSMPPVARIVVGSVAACSSIAQTRLPVTRIARYIIAPKPNVYTTVSPTVSGACPDSALPACSSAKNADDNTYTVRSPEPPLRSRVTTNPRVRSSSAKPTQSPRNRIDATRGAVSDDQSVPSTRRTIGTRTSTTAIHIQPRPRTRWRPNSSRSHPSDHARASSRSPATRIGSATAKNTLSGVESGSRSSMRPAKTVVSPRPSNW